MKPKLPEIISVPNGETSRFVFKGHLVIKCLGWRAYTTRAASDTFEKFDTHKNKIVFKNMYFLNTNNLKTLNYTEYVSPNGRKSLIVKIINLALTLEPIVGKIVE